MVLGQQKRTTSGRLIDPFPPVVSDWPATLSPSDTGAPSEPSLPNLIATATALTAATIARALRGIEGDLIVSGGGVHNRQLLAQIAAFLPQMHIAISADYGIDPDAKEAIAFAVLAHETWRGRPSNLPSATGTRRNVVLGSITR